MKRTAAFFTVAALAACGGGEPASDAPAAGEAAAPAQGAAPAATAPMTTPDWFHVDQAAKTVHMTITAGATEAKNYWNYNGAHDGNMTIAVPEGFTVTIDLVNNDPNMAHSLGISTTTSGFAAAPAAEPAFAGAITEDATSMISSTMPGETESITFTADAAGNYAMMCFVPGHAATGMYVFFNVSSDGSAGVRTNG